MSKRGDNGLQPIGKILQDFDWYQKKYISREFQNYGYRLAEELADLSHKSLYIKLAKELPRNLLEEARTFVKDAVSVRNRAKLFMWKLAELRKERQAKIQIFVGTSGFSYPHWRGDFYPQNLPQKDWFAFYVKHFNTVELNVSFYRLPKKTTFEGWRKKAVAVRQWPDGFVFSLKGSRYISHVKKLKNCQEPLKRFFETVLPIKTVKGVILWQLPPSFKVNVRRLKNFLALLNSVPTLGRSLDPTLGARWRYAFEFRNESWLNKEVFRLLEKHQAAVVFQDFPDWPVTEELTADFVYLRFHGRTKLYSSCYTEKELKNWAKKIKAWQKAGKDVYVYFNNDALGYATKNAKKLISNVKS